MKRLMMTALAATLVAFSAGAAFASLDTHTDQGKIAYVNPSKSVLRMDDGQTFQVPSNLSNDLTYPAGANQEVTAMYQIRPNGQKVLTGLFMDQQESR